MSSSQLSFIIYFLSFIIIYHYILVVELTAERAKVFEVGLRGDFANGDKLKKFDAPARFQEVRPIALPLASSKKTKMF